MTKAVIIHLGGANLHLAHVVYGSNGYFFFFFSVDVVVSCVSPPSRITQP